MIEKITEIIKTHYPDVQAVYLFGSFATENERSDSDADIALLLPFETSKNNDVLCFSECRFALEKELNREVDLVNLRTASTVFQNEVLNSARMIYCADRDAVGEFEMIVLSMYQKLNAERKEILESFAGSKRAYNI